jgi:hypothetical protein
MLTQILLTTVELSMKECKDNLFNQHVCAYTTKEENCLWQKKAVKVNSTPPGNLTLATSGIAA